MNSALIGNRSSSPGVGAAYSTVVNCSVISNLNSFGVYQCRITNSIVYYNPSGNYSGGTFAYSCTTPSPGGTSNIISAPQLLADAIHLASTSPCRSTGTNLATGTDLDGQAWTNPPSMGCDEWQATPIIITQPRIQLTNNPIGFKVSVTFAGLESSACYWTRNGSPIEDDDHFSFSHSTNLIAMGLSGLDAGDYQVTVSNAFGVATSAVVQLVFRYVNASNPVPTFPFTTWAGAATNIQDAIDAAIAGEVVLVTNGIYGFGGKVMGGDLTNRVVLDKAVIVQSANGSAVTTIEGIWNPTATNGPSAVRGAWLTNGSALSGFMIRGGATRQVTSSPNQQMIGGGAWGSSTNAVVANCVIASNTASYVGGGASGVTLVNCILAGNRAIGSGTPGSGVASAGQGGGASGCNLKNCIITGNYAEQTHGGGTSNSKLINCALFENSAQMNGGAAYGGSLLNCTVTRNTSSGYSSGYGAAVHSATATNTVIWGNFSRTTYPNTNYASSTLTYCVSTPLAAGVGNQNVDPQLLADGVHIAETSPCRAAGANVVVGADIDGQTWVNPPSIGCDEWQPVPVIAFAPTYQIGLPTCSLSFNLTVAGQSPAYYWFRNGGLLEDDTHQTNSHTANLKVLKFGPEHAGDYFCRASNSFGMVTSQVTQVVIHCADAVGSNPISPYTTWATAATNIQAAIDAASPGEIVLVTNGVYATGGKIMHGDLLNRIAIDKPITVLSANGYKQTIIEGAWDAATNGPNAVRCVAMVDGATLAGFTIKNGATRTSGNTITLQSGGGVWSATQYTGASVVNCLFTNNSAGHLGGGIFGGSAKNSIFVENLGNFGGSSGGGGGGAAFSELINCTVKDNFCPSAFRGAGVNSCRVYNSIVRGNYPGFFSSSEDNYYPSFSPTLFAYSSSNPTPSGVGNINVWPVFLDWDYHLPVSSPVRGIGSSLYSSGEDMDGEAWASPPSIGADEVIEANLVGPISLTLNTWQTNTLVSTVGNYRFLNFWDSITGRVSRIDWNFGDGVIATNISYFTSHFWTNAGTFTVSSTAYNNDNLGGVSASVAVVVSPLNPPSLQSAILQTNGFLFSFEAEQSVRYDIQYATNLTVPVTWYPLQTIFYSPGGTTQITDPARTNSARFYRVLAQ